MTETAEYWNDWKEHSRSHKGTRKATRQEILEKENFSFLVHHPECKVVGDHWRIDGVWDFWHTGTVMNIKTKDYSSINKLAILYKDKNK